MEVFSREAASPYRIPHAIALSSIMVVAALLQLRLAVGQGLWVDEAFSLAIATGHSLEHPAAEAQASLGDFVEHSTPVPASTLQRYLDHEKPPAGVRRILRAVTMSDTSPPLYYLLLGWWVRLFGTTDLAVRAFSIVCALATFPVVWWIADRIAGNGARVPAVVLLASAPMLFHYATEGRMYSLVWFLASALVALTYAFSDDGRRIPTLVWVVVSAAGFLTHYFFAFVWLACLFWLVLNPGSTDRRGVLAAAGATAVLIFPWYVFVPRTLAQWRVTSGWLNAPQTLRDHVSAPIDLAWNFLSGPRWSGPEVGDWAAGILIAVMALAAGWRFRSQLFTRERALIWLWLAGACVGPVVFDLVNGTATETIPRYALAGAPAAILLVAMGITTLPSVFRVAWVVALVLAWSQSDRALLSMFSREGEPFREIGGWVSSSIGDSDLVIVHSIPSGVLTLARYLDTNTPVAAWVGQLQRRHAPDDIQRLTEGRSKVTVVKVHDMGEPAPEEQWLRDHGTVVSEATHQQARVLTFVPRRAPRFAWLDR
jgi:hypothetical protein